MNNPSELWMRRDHKHDYAFRPLEKALLAGTVDAIYTQSKVFQHIQEATGQLAMIEDLSRYPDWRVQVANTPAVITCTDVMADEHPELVIAYMKAMIKVGRWANENKRAAGAILNRQTFYLDAEDTYQGIKDVDMVPSLSARNLQTIKIGKDFMFSHGYIKHDFDVDEWARPEFLEQAATEVLKEEWERRSWSKLPEGGGLEVEGVAARVAGPAGATPIAVAPATPHDRIDDPSSPAGRTRRHCHGEDRAPDGDGGQRPDRARDTRRGPGRDRCRVGHASSTSASRPSGSTTSPAPSRCREDCSSRRPIRRARDTCRRSTRPVA